MNDFKDEVLDTFKKTTKEYIGNANSIHILGVNSKKLIDASSMQISKLLKLDKQEIIYTSGNLENVNLLLFGYLENFKNKDVNVLIDKKIDNEIKDALDKLEIKIIYFDSDNFPFNKIDDKSILLYFCDIPNYLEEIVNNKPMRLKIALDASSNLKYENFKNIDFIHFDLEKINGILGIGALIRKKNIDITPLLHGGESTTKVRSGTPALALITSFAKNLRLWYINN